MANPHNVYKTVFDFFQLGMLSFAPIIKRNWPSGHALLPMNVAGPANLFDYMLGKAPEKRAQAALFPNLLDVFPSTQREVHYVCGQHAGCRRYFDFKIQEPDFDLPVFIELKHYSPHQGSFSALLGPNGKKNFTLAGDLGKCRPDGHLIQVALFTAVEGFNPPPRANYVSNRFINSYAKSVKSRAQYEPAARAALASWPLSTSYSLPSTLVTASDFQVPNLQLAIGGCVSGRVNFFVGLAK